MVETLSLQVRLSEVQFSASRRGLGLNLGPQLHERVWTGRRVGTTNERKKLSFFLQDPRNTFWYLKALYEHRSVNTTYDY